MTSRRRTAPPSFHTRESHRRDTLELEHAAARVESLRFRPIAPPTTLRVGASAPPRAFGSVLCGIDKTRVGYWRAFGFVLALTRVVVVIEGIRSR